MAHGKGIAERLTEKDKALIRILQEDIPLCPEPYREIAERLGLTQEEVLEKVGRWTENKVIRRFGATVRHQNMGYRANCMVVWRLDNPARCREIGELFAGFPQITHCYRRPTFEGWPYSLYTMIHGATPEDIDRTVGELSSASGLTDYRKLLSLKEWKKSSMKYFCEQEGA